MTESISAERQIVVAYDGSDSADRALHWAARRARQSGAHLRVASVAVRGLDADWAVHRGIDVAKADGVRATGTLLTKPVAPALAHASEHASLLVVGTDRSPENAGLVLGALPLKLAASSRCTLAVIPADSPAARRGVLCGFELDAKGDLALSCAVREARRLGAPLRVVHVMQSVASAGTASETDLTAERVARRLARERIEAALTVAQANDGLDVSIDLSTGDPAMTLIRESEHYEILVMGSHGKSSIDTFLIGSVCPDVLMNIRCPVLVMPAVQGNGKRAMREEQHNAEHVPV